MFKKASSREVFVRLAISGPSGSGKTYSALAIATALGKRIALIDTEHGSGSRYSNRFEYDVAELSDFHPYEYIKLIKMAENSYDVIIIDSFSHAWLSILQIVDSNFSNWAKVRPIERKLIDTILKAKCHIIATMRSKTEWVMESRTNKKGVSTLSPQRIGLAPVQNNSIEYEFDIAGEMDYNHLLTITKSRASTISNKTYLCPGKTFADDLQDWIDDLNSPTLVEARPWKDWKTPEDAVEWAQELMPEISSDFLNSKWQELTAEEGKKALAWVQYIQETLKSEFE
ncbi:ATP-binding protein [Moorena sp. SIO3B2]|uniref:ATP-binding protein n=1 Tax=Moorena sp. SIO3B2 TaxID=2607827 RepID=UPI0013C6465B|nr:ATP-binding protein [Moorena sp. SIO3B2]NEP36025.1 AAA family ATPase [Moorena sp. SIO3B2]